MYQEQPTSEKRPGAANQDLAATRPAAGKKARTEGLRRSGPAPVQQKPAAGSASATSTATATASPQVDGDLPYVEGLQQAFGSEATESAPQLAGPGQLPPEVLQAPEDYPGVAHILNVAESVEVDVARPAQDGGDKGAKAENKNAETHTGIATSVAVGRFVTAAKEVEKNWGTLNKTTRAEKLGEAANSELSAVGVPKVGVVIKDLGQRNGQLDFTPWNLDLNGKRFESATVSADAMAPMANTVYHESRHAEQWFRMARVEAGKGKNGAQIASALSVKRSVADEAAKKPLTGNSKEAKEAADWHKSVYGADRNARNTTLRNLRTHGQAMRDAIKKNEEAAAKYKKLKAEKGDAADETKAALTAWQAAYAAYQTAKTTFDATYAAYRALPEEADAWALGARVQTAYKGS